MKEFLIITAAFIFFLLLRVAKNQLTETHKVIISILIFAILAFGIISRLVANFNWTEVIILVVFFIILLWRVLSYRKR
jgi:hypothetical protein